MSEAVVNDVPILATKIDANVGMLGPTHPGLFEFGDTEMLADLILRAETDPEYYHNLISAGQRLKAKFLTRKEVKKWKSLLCELGPDNRSP